MPLGPGGRVKLDNLMIHFIIQVHNRGLVAAPVTVVRSAKYCNRKFPHSQGETLALKRFFRRILGKANNGCLPVTTALS